MKAAPCSPFVISTTIMVVISLWLTNYGALGSTMTINNFTEEQSTPKTTAGDAKEGNELAKLEDTVKALSNSLKQGQYDRMALTAFVLKSHELDSSVSQAILYGTKLEEGYVYVEEFNMGETPSHSPDCYDLTTTNANVDSVNTLGSCIRVYEGPTCTGVNLFLSGYYTNLKDTFGPIKSINSCQS